MAEDSFETNSTDDVEIVPLSEYDTINTEYVTDENEFQANDDEQQYELNTTGVIMSDDEYSCGAGSFATVLNNIGINITLNEAKEAVNTTINGTTMEGIIKGANKYNLTVYGISVNATYLDENFIVHMSINGTNHWSVVKEITQNYVILADSSMGNVNYTMDDFVEVYTNISIVISKLEKKLDLSQVKFLNNDEVKFISGKGNDIVYRYKKAYKTFRIIKYKNKKRLQWRWVYPRELWVSYSYHNPHKWYYGCWQ